VLVVFAALEVDFLAKPFVDEVGCCPAVYHCSCFYCHTIYLDRYLQDDVVFSSSLFSCFPVDISAKMDSPLFSFCIFLDVVQRFVAGPLNESILLSVGQGRSLLTPGLLFSRWYSSHSSVPAILFRRGTSIYYFFLRWGNFLPHVLVSHSIGISSASSSCFLCLAQCPYLPCCLRPNPLDLVVGFLFSDWCLHVVLGFPCLGYL